MSAMPEASPSAQYRPRSYRFTAAQRLHGRRAFSRVFDARVCKRLGPFSIWGVANDLGHPRLGLSVSRRVGNAVARHRIKRLLREAFRLGQHDWPATYDIVIVVQPHKALALGEYQRLLAGGVRSLHLEWQRKAARQQGK
jgi:ribonuclease P protein component